LKEFIIKDLVVLPAGTLYVRSYMIYTWCIQFFSGSRVENPEARFLAVPSPSRSCTFKIRKPVWVTTLAERRYGLSRLKIWPLNP
jgi:hypothetical protein